MSTDHGPAPSPAPATAGDRVRQVVVLLGALVAIAGAAVGSGAFGGQPVSEAADGALAADATVVVPGSPAFSIWSVIYAGLLLFAVVQALPGRAADARMRAVGWWVLGSMVLNAVWIAVAQAGWLWGTVLVIVALLAVLCVALVRIVRTPAGRPLDTVATEVTVGLYLGWVSVATIANVAAVLAAEEVGELGLGESVWGAVLVAVGALVVVAVAVYGRSRPSVTIPVGLAAGWGLAWIAVARTQGPPTDVVVAVAATIAAVAAVVAPIIVILARRPR
ncbi:tryptophan-rich sensory protein [Isoptericola croceus]|uniref:tryptophan-rich sensory protein n=1 Tax=Isoptericola croceus TaxID=3031406 RepID=UPI0023F92DF7|nr:tryptophan-rich sensory protein [Isoptericola croceus]